MVTTTHTRRHFLALGAASAAGLLAACAAPEQTKPAGTASAAGQAPSPTATTPLGGHEYYEGLPNASWGEAEAVAVRNAAVGAMKAFTNTKGGHGPWWEAFGPLLGGSYAQEAFYIDPSRILVWSWKGPEVSNPSGDPLTATATFITNDGPWSMLLHRTGAKSPWLVFSLSREKEQSK